MWDVIIKVSVGCGVGCGVSSSMKKWPGIHRLRMRDIIARVYGTWSVNVSVNGLSHVAGVVWRHYTNIVSGRTENQFKW